MKKSIALLCGSLLSVSLLAEDISRYVGIDYLSNSTTQTRGSSITSRDFDNDGSGLKFKLGYKNENNLRFQVYVQNENYDTSAFSEGGSDGNLLEFGLDVIKAHKFSNGISPFVEVGAGYGLMSIDGFLDDYISEISLKVGVGVMYNITPTLEAIVGVDYQYRKWDDIEIIDGLSDETLTTKENTSRIYFGANLHF